MMERNPFGLGSVDQLIERLSLIESDSGNKFDPTKVEFIVRDRNRYRFRNVKDSSPFRKLRRAFEDVRDVRVAEFYGSELRVGVSFTDGMRKYLLGNIGYLVNKTSGYRTVKILYPVNR